MKLAVILSIILAFAFFDNCHGVGHVVYNYRLFNQRAVVPAKDGKIVQYEITNPTYAEFNANEIHYVDHYDLGAESTLIERVNDDEKFYLKSKPGQGINAMVTIQCYLSNEKSKHIPSPNTVHEIIVPSAEQFSTIKHKVTLRKENGVINYIQARYVVGLLELKIVDGGIGFEEVTFVIESSLYYEKKMLFTLA